MLASHNTTNLLLHLLLSLHRIMEALHVWQRLCKAVKSCRQRLSTIGPPVFFLTLGVRNLLPFVGGA